MKYILLLGLLLSVTTYTLAEIHPKKAKKGAGIAKFTLRKGDTAMIKGIAKKSGVGSKAVLLSTICIESKLKYHCEVLNVMPVDN
ncbi:MAG: hypothetical protein ISR65_18815 [Bacteriovoracaceae bacterium]|nr:hypothetical protein [Candidatus Brocadiales bacterium]MBL6991842.1 hypothetical protein [Bacteriovoracaceae bacterium]